MKNQQTYPAHIAIIMDGNSRWAKKSNLSRKNGHFKGYEVAFEIIKAACKLDIQHLTLFALSQENFLSRSKLELNWLQEILLHALNSKQSMLLKNNVKLNVLGDLSIFPNKLQDALQQLQIATQTCSGLTLHLALNYSGRWHFAECVSHFAQQAQNDSIFDEQAIAQYMTKVLPACDLLIRTSGEQRLSNFLLWHCAYSELYFSEKLWPDFTVEDFDDALSWYALRDRRFGGRNVKLKEML